MNLENGKKMISLQADAVTLASVIGAIQLATRHPGYNGPSSGLAIHFARELQIAVEQVWPEMGPFLEMGWDPQNDC